MTQSNKSQSGFALLITLLVISIVIAVTLSIIELSLKQLELAVDSRDAEIAFHAASAGLECSQRARRFSSASIELGNNFTLQCFGVTKTMSNNLNGITELDTSNGDVFRYTTSIDWGSGIDARCSDVDIITIVANTGNTRASNLKAQIPNYPSNTKSCAAGARCTIASVAGYSARCADKGALGTLKREILLEF